MKNFLLNLSTLLVTGLGFGQIALISQVTPTTVEQDVPFMISLTYTSTVEIADWQIKLRKIENGTGVEPEFPNDSGIYRGNGYAGEAPINPLIIVPGNKLPIAATPTTVSFMVTAPAANAIIAGFNYKWFVNLKQDAFNITGMEPVVTVVPKGALSSNNFSSIDSSEMFVSNDSNSLVVNSANLKSTSATVYDMSGRSVKEINLKAGLSHDLSLNQGVYFLVTNDNRKLKFAL